MMGLASIALELRAFHWQRWSKAMRLCDPADPRAKRSTISSIIRLRVIEAFAALEVTGLPISIFSTIRPASSSQRCGTDHGGRLALRFGDSVGLVNSRQIEATVTSGWRRPRPATQ
jgi:hypothetical protein